MIGKADQAAADYEAALSLSQTVKAEEWVGRLSRDALLRLQIDRAANARGKQPSERRIALVIANAKYKAVSVLANPPRDANAIATTLRRVGFQSVTVVSDVTREAFINSLRVFAKEAEKADWAVVYFAGHGIEIGGANFLLPVDARLESDRDIRVRGNHP